MQIKIEEDYFPQQQQQQSEAHTGANGNRGSFSNSVTPLNEEQDFMMLEMDDQPRRLNIHSVLDYQELIQSSAEDLPEVFDFNAVTWKRKPQCQLCDLEFGVVTRRHRCRKCGRSVCQACSTKSRRLCAQEKQKFKVCDLCDTVLSNKGIEQMYKNILHAKNENIDYLEEQIWERQ